MDVTIGLNHRTDEAIILKGDELNPTFEQNEDEEEL
jgi:hypothetical protein